VSGGGSLRRSTTPGHDLSLVKRYAGLVIDLDGVVVRGTEPIREAVAFLGGLQGDAAGGNVDGNEGNSV
jgi:hypothetical protein